MSGNPAQSAFELLQAGLAVTSTATPALDGTYSLYGPLPQDLLQAEINAIALTGAFADGTASLVWLDTGSAQHTLDVEQFKSLAAALMQFLAACRQYAAGILGAEPPTSATIP